jgi:sulfide:quinone oxidoreductase
VRADVARSPATDNSHVASASRNPEKVDSSAPLRNFGGAPARVVIVGGGVAALEAMIALRALAQERVTIDLLAPERHFTYEPLSVLEPFDLHETPRFEVARITADQGARHHADGIAAVDTDRKRIWTKGGRELRYDALIVATGARPVEAVRGALHFGGQRNVASLVSLLAEVERGEVRRIIFAIPAGVVWALPAYELALNTAAHLSALDLPSSLTLVTPEDSPLGLFGPAVSDMLRGLIADAGIELRTSSYPKAVDGEGLALVPAGHVATDRVVALPRLEGRYIEGLPRDERGFIPTELDGQVEGVSDVYAAGDVTTFPVKQGGIAAEQAAAIAETIAETIAERAGAPVAPEPFRPVLRGLLVSGSGPRYLSAHITRGPAIESEAGVEPLWWPPSKIAGRYLAPFLARWVSADPPAEAGADIKDAIPFELDLEGALRGDGGS